MEEYEQNREGVVDFDTKMNEILGYQRDELRPLNKIGASQLGYCPRNIVTSKLGLREYDGSTQGTLFKGTAFHEALQDHDHYRRGSGPAMDEFEREVSHSFDVPNTGFETYVEGHIDAVDANENMYEFKTTRGLQYVEDSPKQERMDQTQAYMVLGDFEEAELVYVQSWVGDDDDPLPTVQHSVERDAVYFFEELVPKAHEAHMHSRRLAPVLEEDGMIDEDMLPEQCDRFYCREEQLNPDMIY